MSGDDAVDRDFLLEVVRRAPMLAALRAESMDRPDLQARLGISKSTGHRNLTSLTERGMVEKSGGEYALTEFGQVVADVVGTFEADVETIVRLAPVLDAVSDVVPPFPTDAFADATVTSADHGDPFGPLARFVSLVRETDSLRMADSYAVAPTYIDEIHGRVLDGLETRVVERPEVAEDVMENYPRKCVELCASEFLSMKLSEEIPFGLVVMDDRVGVGVRDSETGVPRTFVDTGEAAARDWAETVFESYWEEAPPLERFNPTALAAAIETDFE